MATYKIVSHGGNGLPLNVETTSTISGRTNVNIWKDTGAMIKNGVLIVLAHHSKSAH